jgi:hypothetical protein
VAEWIKSHYRQGRKLGRTIYRHTGPEDDDGTLIGIMDTVEDAYMVCAALNDYEDWLARLCGGQE